MFEKATRMKLRFQTSRGFASVEDLWDMPLKHDGRSKKQDDGFNLNEVARHISREIKASEEEDFVSEKTTADKTEELRLNIVKHIIAVKLEEARAARDAAARKAQRDKAREILAKRKDAKLEELSDDELAALAAGE